MMAVTSGKNIIYGLVDPVTGLLRYIGKSCSGLTQLKRLEDVVHRRPVTTLKDEEQVHHA